MQYENEQGLRIEPDGQGGWKRVSDKFERSLAPSKWESFDAGATKAMSAPLRGVQSLLGMNQQNDSDASTVDQYYNQNPVSYFGGQVAGAAPAIMATAGLGGSMAGQIGLQGALGAAQAPEDPLIGAAMGAGGTALIPAIGAAYRGARGAVQGMPNLPMMGQGSYAVPGAQAGRPVTIGERVMGAVAREDPNMVGPPAPRVLSGTMTAQELDNMGVPLLESQRIKLGATNPDEMLRGSKQRWYEELKGSPEDVLQAQRQAFTGIVKQELGMEGAPIFTRATVADQLAQQGRTIGEFRKASGPIDLGAEGLTKIKEVADQSLSGASADFKRVLGDIETSMARGGGLIDPKDANTIMTRLGKMSAPGGEYGTISGAKDILNVFNDSLQANRTSAEKAAYADAMYKYKILKALDKGAAIGADSYVNPTSFGKNWDRVTGQTLRGKDVLGRAADTFDALGYKDVHAGNTLQRRFAQAPGKIAEALPGAALTLGTGALGYAGLNSLLGN